MPIYLASKSPRRQELLKQIGISFTCLSSEIDETPLAEEAPVIYVERIAREKAIAGWNNNKRTEQRPVLAADTSVVLDGKIMGKPVSNEHAMNMLETLSEKTHQVITSVAITDGVKLEKVTNITNVTFCKLPTELIGYYVRSGECADKAGAYAIQGFAARFVKFISGSYSGVVGLPLYETAQLLQKFK